MLQQNWDAATKQILFEHLTYLKALHQQGVMKLVGKTDYDINNPENMGLAIFEAENDENANEIMQNDPCIKSGVMTARLHPFSLVFYSGK